MIRGVYAITSGHCRDTQDLLSRTSQVLHGGARVVQYRDKDADDKTRLGRATALVDLCRRFDVPLIINDDIELAARSGAAGVHLGKHDASLKAARELLGDDAIVGVSCYASMRRAVQARDHGASYVAFGAMYPSPTKPLAPLAPRELITAASELLDVSVVAIGGITLDNAAPVIAAGADAIAVISAVYGAPDSQQATEALAALFNTTET